MSKIKSVIGRVANEKKELDIKLSELLLFINSVEFVKLRSAHRVLLLKQFSTMDEYSKLLRDKLIELEKDLKNEQD